METTRAYKARPDGLRIGQRVRWHTIDQPDVIYEGAIVRIAPNDDIETVVQVVRHLRGAAHMWLRARDIELIDNDTPAD